MKRIIIYVGILAALLAAPVEPLRIGELIPVRVVSVQKENGWTVITTDTGNKGMGGDAQQALRNLKDTASGKIYLDTAEYLLVGKYSEDTVEMLRSEMKKSVQLCATATTADLGEAAKYLAAQGELPKLKDWKMGMELPVIGTFGDALIFLKKVENSA